MNIIALTRDVSPRIVECELRYVERQPIDVERARSEHAAYKRMLERLGCRVEHIAPAPDHPDGVFVEDTAVVLDEVAIITRPGAESRRGETETVAAALRRYRPLMQTQEPATLDGGDVLHVGRTLYAGRTERTNDEGIEQLRAFVLPFGYTVRPVAVDGALHLKTAATQIAEDTLLINPDWVEASAFEARTVTIDPRERFAANVLRLGDALLCATAFPHTRRLLEKSGYRVEMVDVSEMLKAEAGVTCCSLILRAP